MEKRKMSGRTRRLRGAVLIGLLYNIKLMERKRVLQNLKQTPLYLY